MKIRFFVAIILFFLSAFFSACATVHPFRPKISPPEHIFTKNYILGKRQSVYIGEEVVKVKDYKKYKKILNKMEALNDFEVNIPFHYHQGFKGDIYPIFGITRKGNNYAYLVLFPSCPFIKFGINKNGYSANFAIGVNNALAGFTPNFTPKDTKFQIVKEEKIDISQGITNFEIIYTGITGQSINLLYREYTPENLARVAFYQNLTYPIDSNTIRFRKIKIQLHKITSESIAYTVIEDGLKK